MLIPFFLRVDKVFLLHSCLEVFQFPLRLATKVGSACKHVLQKTNTLNTYISF